MEVDSDFTLTLLSNGSEKYFPNDASQLLPIVGTNINQLESAEVINPTTLVFSKKIKRCKRF